MVNTVNAQKIAALYATVFNRAPDKAGFDFWLGELNAGLDFNSLAGNFAFNDLGNQLYGSTSNEQFVTAMYKNGLNGAQDSEGIAYWTQALDEGMERGDFIATLITSVTDTTPESDLGIQHQDTLGNKVKAGLYFTKALGDASNVASDAVTPAQIQSDPAFIASVHAIEGVTYAPESVTESMAWSDGQATILNGESGIPSLTPEEQITSLYIAMFNRAPDEGGLEYWMDALNAGTSFEVIAESFTHVSIFNVEFDGISNKAFVDEVYINLINQRGDPEVTTTWANALDNGMTKSEFVVSLLQTIMGAEEGSLLEERKQIVENKIEVALHFTHALGDQTNISEENLNGGVLRIMNDPAYIASIKAIEGITADRESVENAINAIDFREMDVVDAIELYQQAQGEVSESLDAVNEFVRPDDFTDAYTADEAGVAAARADAQDALDEVKVQVEASVETTEGDKALIKDAFSEFIGRDKPINEENVSLVKGELQAEVNADRSLFDKDGNALVTAGTESTITLSDNDDVLNLARLDIRSQDMNVKDTGIVIDLAAGGQDTIILPTLTTFLGSMTINGMTLGDGEEADTLVSANLAQQFASIRFEPASGTTVGTDSGNDAVFSVVLTNKQGGTLTLDGVMTANELLALINDDGATLTAAQVESFIDALNGDLATDGVVEVTHQAIVDDAIESTVSKIDVNRALVSDINKMLGENLQTQSSNTGTPFDFTAKELQDVIRAIEANGTQSDFNALLDSAKDAFIEATGGVGGIGEQLNALNTYLDAVSDNSGMLGEAQLKFVEDSKLIDSLEASIEAREKIADWFDEFGYQHPVEILSDLTATEGKDIYTYEGQESNGFTLSDFGKEGKDSIYLGEEKSYSLVKLDANADIAADNVGDVAALEVFWQQNGDDVDLFIENTTFAGTDASMSNLSHITLVGVSGDSLNADDIEQGLLSMTQVAA